MLLARFMSGEILGHGKFEYFNGHSPNGQFFKDKIEYFGIAAHLYY